jgi:HAD superfamily phosphoserine phosphatase-like hydrolase
VIRLVAFDVDGTITRGATVCQVLAEPLGRLERMNALEQVSGRRAVQAARDEMALWYQGRPAEQLRSYLSAAQLAPGVNEGFGLLRRHGTEIALVSITWLFAVEWFAERLGAVAALGTGLSLDGQIGHVWAEDKARCVAELAQARGVDLRDVAGVGDSSGDLPMLKLVGLPIFVGRSVPAGVSRVIHLPDGDIAEVARRIVRHG